VSKIITHLIVIAAKKTAHAGLVNIIQIM